MKKNAVMDRRGIASLAADEYSGAERQVARIAALRATPNASSPVSVAREAARLAVEQYRGGLVVAGTPGPSCSRGGRHVAQEERRFAAALKDRIRDNAEEE